MPSCDALEAQRDADGEDKVPRPGGFGVWNVGNQKRILLNEHPGVVE